VAFTWTSKSVTTAALGRRTFPFHRFYGGRKGNGKELAVDRGHSVKWLKVQVRTPIAYVALDCEGQK
jgi:hypothetical protein